MIPPSEFGLLGLALPVITVLRLLGASGLPVVVVRSARLDRATYAAYLAASLILGGVAALVGVAAAWPMARIYAEPDLVPVTVALAGSCLLVAWSTLAESRLERSLRFETLAGLRLAALVGSTYLTVQLALLGGGVWALVVGQTLEFLFVALLAQWALRRDPLPASVSRPTSPGAEGDAPPPTTWSGLRATVLAVGTSGAVGFGGAFTLAVLITNVGQGLDKILLGWAVAGLPVGDAAVGQYAQAFNLFLRPVYLIAGAVGAIALPALAAVARAEESPSHTSSEATTETTASATAFTALTTSLLRAATVLLAPVAAGLAVTAPPVMVAFAGPAWLPAGRLLAILAPTILAQGIINLCGPILLARGRGGSLLAGTTAWFVLLAGALLAAIAPPMLDRDEGDRRLDALFRPPYPTCELIFPPEDFDDGRAATIAVRVAVGYMLATGLTAPLMLVFTLRRCRVPVLPVLRTLLPGVVAAVGMGLIVAAAAWACRTSGGLGPTTPAGQFAAIWGGLIVLGVVAYVALAWREVAWVKRFFHPPRS